MNNSLAHHAVNSSNGDQVSIADELFMNDLFTFLLIMTLIHLFRYYFFIAGSYNNIYSADVVNFPSELLYIITASFPVSCEQIMSLVYVIMCVTYDILSSVCILSYIRWKPYVTHVVKYTS